jgi:LmbE family N-acetylglucosaminyl deacetylase
MSTILSPHLDDAILSLGDTIASSDERPGIVTVLGGMPPTQKEGEVYLSDYDRACGFDNSAQAMRVRRREDDAACDIVGAVPVRWDFLDYQYDNNKDPHPVIEMIQSLHASSTTFYAPLGIGHPDHRFVALCVEAAIRCLEDKRADETPLVVHFYEELPYRVLHPEQVWDRLRYLNDTGWSSDPLPAPLIQEKRALKEAAVHAYGSQFPEGPLDPCILVPERVWRCWR